MKPNVDLTENRIFHTRSEFETLEQTFRKMMFGRFPWIHNGFKIISSEKDIKQQNQIVFTGNKKERELSQQLQNMSLNPVCECCGKPLNKFPWEKTSLLICKDCDEELEISIRGKFPWGK